MTRNINILLLIILFFKLNLFASSRIEMMTTTREVLVRVEQELFMIGEILAVRDPQSQSITAFVEVESLTNQNDGTYLMRCRLLRHSRYSFTQVGYPVERLDLTTENESYLGTTELIIKKSHFKISSKYKPLFTQGMSIGDTSKTLWENEFVLSWLGHLYYGVTDRLTMNTIIPLNAVGGNNLSAKYNFYDSDANSIAVSMNYNKIPQSRSHSVNASLIWDSVSSENVITHSYLSLALATFEDAKDVTAFKYLGTSSFQTGYEFILNNWDRILIGPNYNFEKKSVGGYLTYMKILDRFHFSLNMISTNVSEFKYSVNNGYFVYFDMFWRL